MSLSSQPDPLFFLLHLPDLLLLLPAFNASFPLSTILPLSLLLLPVLLQSALLLQSLTPLLFIQSTLPLPLPYLPQLLLSITPHNPLLHLPASPPLPSHNLLLHIFKTLLSPSSLSLLKLFLPSSLHLSLALILPFSTFLSKESEKFHSYMDTHLYLSQNLPLLLLHPPNSPFSTNPSLTCQTEDTIDLLLTLLSKPLLSFTALIPLWPWILSLTRLAFFLMHML
jgi:hypothetical protein